MDKKRKRQFKDIAEEEMYREAAIMGIDLSDVGSISETFSSMGRAAIAGLNKMEVSKSKDMDDMDEIGIKYDLLDPNAIGGSILDD